MIAKPLSEISDSDIQELKDAGIEEGKTIEYKRELPGTRDEDKREFLADISSFSNTEGGDVIYGVTEERGVIAEITGLSSPDLTPRSFGWKISSVTAYHPGLALHSERSRALPEKC